VRAVLEDCHIYDLPLFLEPISYSLDAQFIKGTAEFARQRRRSVVESARRLGALQPDVLKVEFPLDARYEADETAWREACAELNAAVSVPWVVLSANETFETFKRQLQIACEAGASGFIAGRSIWRDAVPLVGSAREAFLTTIARQRLSELVDIAQAYGRPWTERSPVLGVNETWYQGY
jgi:tagatose 1,6-diphosphate aldolase